MRNFKKTVSRLGDSSHLVLVFFYILRLRFVKIEKKGSTENLGTSQCCTIQQNPERDPKISSLFMHIISLRHFFVWIRKILCSLSFWEPFFPIILFLLSVLKVYF